MNEAELQQAAREYAQRIMFTVDFGIEKGQAPEAVDHIYTPIHDQLVAAYLAGYRAGSSPKEAA